MSLTPACLARIATRASIPRVRSRPNTAPLHGRAGRARPRGENFHHKGGAVMKRKFDPDTYEMVHARITRFYDRYPEGTLSPAFLDPPHYRIETIGDHTFLVYAAFAYRHPHDIHPGYGMAWEPFPGQNPDAALMIGETSAWGRALAAIGFPGPKGVATKEEVEARAQPPSAKHLADPGDVQAWKESVSLDVLLEALEAVGQLTPSEDREYSVEDMDEALDTLTEADFERAKQAAA